MSIIGTRSLRVNVRRQSRRRIRRSCRICTRWVLDQINEFLSRRTPAPAIDWAVPAGIPDFDWDGPFVEAYPYARPVVHLAVTRMMEDER